MQNFDPRTKILIVVCLSTIAMIISSLWILLGVLIGMIILMLTMGITIGRIKKQMLAVVGMIVFVMVLQAIFGQWQLGFLLAIRLMILLFSALILLTGEPRDYLLAFVQMHMPYELAYMIILSFHFFPLLREEALDIYYSIQLRGTEIEKERWTKKLGIYKKMCIPILAGALARAKDTSIAMEARGFRAKGKRTYMRWLKLRVRDVIFMIAIVCVSIGLVAFAWNYDGPSPPELVIGNTTDFMIVGDVQYTLRDRDYELWGDMIEDGYSQNSSIEFALFMGDMVDNPANEKDWKAFFSNERRALGDLQIYPTPGNHETSITPKAYLTKFKLPQNGPASETANAIDSETAGETADNRGEETASGNSEGTLSKGEFYSIDRGSCHIVSLNSCYFMDERKGEPEYEEDKDRIKSWIKKDLKKANSKQNSDTTWNIVFMHHPMYPVIEDVDLYETLRKNWEDIFVEAGVDVVFCGHQHCYMRTSPRNGNAQDGNVQDGNAQGGNAQDGVTYVMSNSGQKTSHYVDEKSEIPNYAEVFQEDKPCYIIAKASKHTLRIYTYNADNKKIDSFKLTN